MIQESKMGILEFRKYLLSNLDKYTLTDLNKRLEVLEQKQAEVEKRYNDNKIYETELFNISCQVATYRLAIKKMPIYEPVVLKLSKDGMQYSLF